MAGRSALRRNSFDDENDDKTYKQEKEVDYEQENPATEATAHPSLNFLGARFGTTRSQHVPVAGRRAGAATETLQNARLSDPDVELLGTSDQPQSRSDVPVSRRKESVASKGGWGLSEAEGAEGKLKKKFARQKKQEEGRRSQEPGDVDDMGDHEERPAEPDSLTRRQSLTVLHDNPDEVTVVIPDLADVEIENLTSCVAAAPSNKANRMLALRELEKELNAGMTANVMLADMAHGIDLGLLTSTMNHPDEIAEEDRYWDWSIVFNQVASEIQSEMEANENLDKTPDASDFSLNQSLGANVVGRTMKGSGGNIAGDGSEKHE